MTALPKWLVLTLPTPSIMMWGTEQMSSRITVSDTEDLQKFVQMELVPSTPQLIVTLGAIGLFPLLLAVCLYKKRRSEMVTIIKTEFVKLKRYFIIWIGVSLYASYSLAGLCLPQWPMTEWYGISSFFLNR